MKPQTFLKNIGLTLTVLCLSLFAQAQTKALDVNVDIDKGGSGGTWYASPWVWIVGAAVFILLLAAIMRGGNSRSDA